jgi:hypothetical protein
MAAKVAGLEHTIEEANNEQAKKDCRLKTTARAVRRHFGWSKATADPVLFRAAVGFWSACTMNGYEGEDRIGVKNRIDIWLQLTCYGFKGKVMEVLERRLKQRQQFDVVELARKSDVNSPFNATAVGAVSQCEVGKKKYDRGMLCSEIRCDTTSHTKESI